MTRLLALVAAMLLSTAAAAVPTTLTYAGVLKDGDKRVNDTVDVTFTLFDASVAGEAKYTEEVPALIVLDGDLVAELGNNALDDELLALPELWLEVAVDGEPLLPRVRMNSVPYALRAEAALVAESALTFGGLFPADYVTQEQLADFVVDTDHIANASITTAKVASPVSLYRVNSECSDANALTLAPVCVLPPGPGSPTPTAIPNIRVGALLP